MVGNRASELQARKSTRSRFHRSDVRASPIRTKVEDGGAALHGLPPVISDSPDCGGGHSGLQTFLRRRSRTRPKIARDEEAIARVPGSGVTVVVPVNWAVPPAPKEIARVLVKV